MHFPVIDTFKTSCYLIFASCPIYARSVYLINIQNLSISSLFVVFVSWYIVMGVGATSIARILILVLRSLKITQGQDLHLLNCMR